MPRPTALRSISTSILAGLALAVATGAYAQTSRKIPIQHDLQRWDENEARLWFRGYPPRSVGPFITSPRDVEVTGSLGPDNSVTPRNPTGVVGFDGPPGIIGDSVLSYSPLRPGAPGNEGW